MTAEIALMNNKAVVLAADSAVTIGTTGKIYHAEKLFSLRTDEPVGMMIYNSTDYLNIPWETLIKTYANTTSREVQPTIVHYVSDFLTYVCKKVSGGEPEHVEEIQDDGFSGIVVAGFGEEELRPTLVALRVLAVEDVMIYTTEEVSDFELEDLGSVVRPFAQSEMVPRFFDGVDLDLLGAILSRVEKRLKRFASDLSELVPGLDDQLGRLVRKHVKAYERGLKSHIDRHYSGPIVHMIESLPKEELADLAESLVSLTALKRRVAPEQETVGGPIDVAIISKGDGFVWHKRDSRPTGKHTR